jgi:hypothetical protein
MHVARIAPQGLSQIEVGSACRFLSIAGVVVFGVACVVLLGVQVPGERPLPSQVRVVDAFVSARAAVDVNAMPHLLHQDAQIVDLRHDRATSIDGLYQLLPLGETLDISLRQVNDLGEVTWTETVLQSARPSSEITLEAITDLSSASTAIQWAKLGGGSSEPIATSMNASGYARAMRAIVVQSRIVVLVIAPTATHPLGPSMERAEQRIAGAIAVAATSAMFAYLLVLVRPTRSAQKRPTGGGETLTGLQAWMAARRQ